MIEVMLPSLLIWKIQDLPTT